MPKRVLSGTVVSDKGEKTVVVRVERRVKHPLYGKIIKLSKKYHAHDEANAYRSGEQIRIEECAPISRLKTWTVLDRIGAAKAAVVEISEPDALAPEAQPAKPVEDKAAKPVEEKKAPKPVEDKAAKPVEEKAATPVEEKAAKPVEEKAAKPVEEKAAKPAAEKKAAKPVEEKAAKPAAAKKAAKPAKKPAKKAKAEVVGDADA